MAKKIRYPNNDSCVSVASAEQQKGKIEISPRKYQIRFGARTRIYQCLVLHMNAKVLVQVTTD